MTAKIASVWSLLATLLIVPLTAAERTAAATPPIRHSPDEQQSPRRASRRVAPDPYAMISQELLLTWLTGLTSIRPYAGWRTSASSGEHLAVEHVVAQLAAMPGMDRLGLELERQPFRTFNGIELRPSWVLLTTGTDEAEVPATAISGPRDDLERALWFDSDGQVNDLQPDPVVISGPPHLLRWQDDPFALPDLSGRVLLLDYALVDRAMLDLEVALAHAEEIVSHNPAAIIAITSFSNLVGASHGTFANDLPIWIALDRQPPPILNLRLEDLQELGISSLDDLALVQSVGLSWDADVTAPGESENLVAVIPGVDRSHTVLLGAHIDSPNSPGANDDGSGSVVLLQVAYALAAAGRRPPVDLALVWFGSEERGLYGSSVFAAAHQELLDRSIAMLQIDCLMVRLAGLDAYLHVSGWTYEVFGDDRPVWPQLLTSLATARSIFLHPFASYATGSDHFNFNGWNVPNANLSYGDPYDGSNQVHYAGHLHDPYDTVSLVRNEAAALEQMATIALAAGIETGRQRPALRVTPLPDRRAVFVGSHTESAHMTPAQLIWLSMALAWHGFDVDMVPYGQTLTDDDLAHTDLVVVLPVHDYPVPGSGPDPLDEAWTEAEVDALVSYAHRGGLLVLTNSAHRLKGFNTALEVNEDAGDLNLLAERFGISFDGAATIAGASAATSIPHALVNGVGQLAMIRGNGVPFTATAGQVLAWSTGQAVVHLQAAGAGEVLTLADLGLLGDDGDNPENLAFWENLASYARSR